MRSIDKPGVITFTWHVGRCCILNCIFVKHNAIDIKALPSSEYIDVLNHW